MGNGLPRVLARRLRLRGRIRKLLIGGVGVLLVGVLFAPAFAGETSRPAARELYKKGLRAFRAGQIGQALETFRRAEDTDPTYPFPPFALARIYHQLFEQEMSHYRDAAEAYDRAVLLLEISPPGPRERALYQAYYFQGLLLLKGGEYVRALRAFDRFLEVYPDFYNLEVVHNARGIALYYMDQFDQAVAAFREALKVQPDLAEARFNLRSVYTRLSTYNEALASARAGDLETALDRIGRLREYAPRYLPGRRLEADLLARLGRTDEAGRVYREILALAPSAPISYGVRLSLARLLEARGDTAGALELLRENLRRFPRIADHLARRETEALLKRLEAAP